ncbi:MAG: hypothetical protein ACYCY9_09600 [Thiobacillus sp.]
MIIQRQGRGDRRVPPPGPCPFTTPASRAYGAARHAFTGSKAHHIEIRRTAQKHGLKLNEYGVLHGAERIAGDDEISAYRSVGLPCIPPELARMAAKAMGLEYLAVTEHSRHLTVAHGLDPLRLARQCDRIDRETVKTPNSTASLC